MELDCDLSQINNEEMLRKMWQQAEDVDWKKEIRSHLYKLRETRLRDLYTSGDDQLIMSGNSNAGFAKDPLLPSHGDSLADQSFQSLKSREVRDSSSPAHDMKFHSLALSQPSTTGWDVRSSSEVSPDGRAYRSETVATTDGKEKLNGGVAEFKGRNEQHSSASHQGDDKNFIKKAAESSNTHLQEKVVIGDEHSGRTEIKKSSTTMSSSSKVISSSSTTQHGDNEPIAQPQYRQITDSSNQRLYDNEQRNARQEEQQYRQNHETTSTNQQQTTRQEQHNETYNQSRRNTSENVETQRHYEENKHYVDMDKASPEYQRHVQYLMAQPGEIISSTVEYPKPNVKMITTVKRLPDGTVVKNKRYETEEIKPASERVQQRSSTTATNTSNQQHTQEERQQRIEKENLQSRLKNSRERNTTTTRQISPQRSSIDAVDNAQTRNYTQDRQQQLVSTQPQYTDDVTNETSSTTFSTVKKSSHHFSTETATERVEEINDGTTTRKEKLQDFSTHGFPSVKPHKPTQEYPTDRPSPVRTTAVDELTRRDVNDLHAPTNVRTIKTPDGDVIVVSKETQRSVKQKSNTERIIETEVVSDAGDRPQQQAPQRITEHTNKQHHQTTEDFRTVDRPRHCTPTYEQPHQPQRREDFTTHGFPSVKENSPVWDDMPRHHTPTRDHASPAKIVQPYNTNQEQHSTYNTETKHTSKHQTNAERIIEVVTEKDHHSHHQHPDHYHHHPDDDFSTHGFPSVRNVKKTRDISPVHTTPVRERTTSPHGYPSARSPTRSKPDYSTHGFPSARSPTRSKPDYSAHGSPSPRDAKPKPRTSQSPQRRVVTTTSTRKPTTTSSTTTTDSRSSLRKEHDVDATHRRFAASLRSSSPVDHQRRDSHDSHHYLQQRQKSTPRSSISSQATTRTFRRDQREGSHESAAPSETSRISSSTVTRQSPGKNVGKTVVTTKQTVVKTRNTHGSNDTIDLTQQRNAKSTTPTITIKTKSPSPGKSVTTTTTTTTTSSTHRAAPKTPTTPTKTMPTTPTKSTPITPTTPTKSTATPISKPTTSPKTDNQLTKPTADEQIPINHETLTIIKTDFSSNDATLPQNEAIIEEPICRKKNFYQLGPSDEIPTPLTTTTTNITTEIIIPKDAKSSSTYSPTAPNSHSKIHRTSQEPHRQQQPHHVIKKDSPEREYAPIRFTSENEITNEIPLQPNDVNKTTKHVTKNIKTNNEVSKTVLRETTFEKTENEKQRNVVEPQYDSDEPSVTSDFEPYQRNVERPKYVDESQPTSTHENKRVEELFNVNVKTQKVNKNVKENVNEKFINTEQIDQIKYIDENTDGGFISKEPQEEEPTTPTYRKKGLTRRETFEERCRQILGMEDSGDTQGSFKQTPDKDEFDQEPKDKTTKPEIDFVVKIEDCDDDDDYYKPRSVVSKENAMPKTKPKPKVAEVDDVYVTERVKIERKETKPQSPKASSPLRESPIEPSTPTKSKSPETYVGPKHRKAGSNSPRRQTPETKPASKNKSPSPTRRNTTPSPTRAYPVINEQTNIEITTSSTKQHTKSKSPNPSPMKKPTDIRSESEIETESYPESEIESAKENFITEKVIDINKSTVVSTNKNVRSKTINVNSTPTKTAPAKLLATPLKQTPKSPQKSQPNTSDDTQNDIKTTKVVKTTAKHTISPKTSPKSTTKFVETVKETTKTHKGQNGETNESTIKDRLRSSTRRSPSKPKTDQRDGSSSSSPEPSPTRNTERRRSSNISVHTEIIIDHAGSKSPERETSTMKRKPQQPTTPKKPGTQTTPDTATNRKLPVTDRKESAPVHRVTRREDDIKMSRASSEKIIKVNGQNKPTAKKPTEPITLSPKREPRPNKCFTTKTINLTTNEQLVNSEDIENVIIDIQHAKSSREPSPDKIVPTPVPADLYTGSPRYPDIVHEPEDEPRKKPVIKNIPILEEGTNSYVKCHITEINVERTNKTTINDHTDFNDEILTQPTIEAPNSLDYPSIETSINQDESLLSVHEKVNKFINTAEETSKPKTSSPFNPNAEKEPKVQVPEDDECLLTVDQKVTKFLQTAESISKTPITQPRDIKRPNLEDLDEEIRNDECTLSVSEKVSKFVNTAEKLVPSTPQKSPQLVARIERHISRQSEPGDDEEDEKPELEPFSENHTVELELKRQKDILTRPSVWDKNGPKEPAEYTLKPEDKDELVPMSKTHTTDIELKRQKDILSRPSVFEGRKTPQPQSPTPTKKSTISERKQTFKTTQNHLTEKESEEITINISKNITDDNRSTDEDDVELVPMSKTHTTEIERRRQKDILTRPSVFEGRKNPQTHSPTPAKKSTILEQKPTYETKQKLSTEKEQEEVTIKMSKNINDECNSTTKKTPHPRVESPKDKSPTARQPQRSTHIDTKLTTTVKTTRTVPNGKQNPIVDETESDIEFTETENSILQSNKSIETNRTNSKISTQISHSPTRRSNNSRSSSPQKSTKPFSPTTNSDLNQRNTNKPHTLTPSKPTEIIFKPSIVEKSPKDTPAPVPQSYSTKKTKTITESVAARRNIFEKAPTKPASPIDDRRPSYMDHTRSSLEHIRRDSLEVNKTHYARKPSLDDDNQLPTRPNSTVKFDLPQKPRKHESISEDINIEDIFELEILEEMLETVTSYELRRRIRAQIRLIKKNAQNTTHTESRTTSSNKSSTYHSSFMHSPSSSKPHHPHYNRHEDIDILHHEEKHAQKSSPYERSNSPLRGHDNIGTHPRDRSQSPTKTPLNESSTSKHYKRTEQVDYAHKDERSHSRQETREVHQSPQRTDRQQSPSYKPPIKPRDRSLSPDIPKSKSPTTRGSPVPKPRERSQSPQQQKPTNFCEEKRTSVTKTTVRTTHSPERKSSKPKPDEKTPIWADRKNILKPTSNHSSPVPTRKAPGSPMTRTSATKTTKSFVSQRQTKSNEEDCITSSYGIGPTDENGLPLFGIKALKKKSAKPMAEPCETTDEVTGYVIEEQWYSDGTKVPKHERKEFIYSTNDEDLKSMKKQVESRSYTKDNAKVTRKYQKIDKDQVHQEPQAIMSGNVEDFSASNTKHVRRGSVKEMSEKFIRKESSQSISEKSTSKSSVYPKAGLILRTNSRKGSLGANDDVDDDDAGMLSTMTTTSTTTSTTSKKQPVVNITKTTKTIVHDDNYDNDDYESAHAHDNYKHAEHEDVQSTTRSFHESESECESMSKKHEFVSKKSSSSMSSATRSFLNTTGESRAATNIDDVLERMRNADNVVEQDDTPEDQEARALLNKFLGASVIMRGVETGGLGYSPATKNETKTTSKTSYNNDGDQVTTTRVTKTIKSSGNSSTPVTYTTCDIEEIWDEEILKQLLERATTYEERRKIRARLRELMAEREEKSASEEESSESEYEEIVEEVTDYSETDEDDDNEKDDDDDEKTDDDDNDDDDDDEGDELKEESFKSLSQASVKKSSSVQSNESVEESVEESVSQKSEDLKKLEIVEETVETDAKVVKVEEEKAAVKTVEATTKPQTQPAAPTKVQEQSGELLLPLLQNLLHKSQTPAAKQLATNKQTANQYSKHTNTNLTSRPPCKINTNRTVFGGGGGGSGNSNSGSSGSSGNFSRVSFSNSKNSPDHFIKKESSFNNQKSQFSNSSLQSTTTASTSKQKEMLTKNSQLSANNRTHVQSERLNVPPREDSGTESGEDLRLIAAGLRDKLQMQDGDSNLIEEVTTALSRLESSLKEGRDIALDGQKRKALLALVARLQTGLTSPEHLDQANSQRNASECNEENDPNFDEISSPEFDANRNNRHRFARRRNRNSRHTVGVSREELADARRYMEDRLMIDSLSNCTTPDSSGGAGTTATTTPPQWFPLEKNASSGAILYSQAPSQPLFRPNQFVPNKIKKSMDHLTVEPSGVVLRNNNGKQQRRPLSGEISVSFQDVENNFATDGGAASDGSRFNNKKQFAKRANTIDIPKTKKYNPDFDTDSEIEDKGPHLGLKRTVQVSVKNKVRNVVPEFEPKTENDRKFLAFINKQSPKHGLGWTANRSVTNWTNKFGNIKNTFEVGAAATATTGKPPQVPGHYSAVTNRKQPYAQDYSVGSNLRNQQQDALENQRLRMERDRIERERIERDRQERQHYERERMERDRLERERHEKQRLERERIEREYYERERLRKDRERRVRQQEQQEQLIKQQQQQQLMQQQQQQAAEQRLQQQQQIMQQQQFLKQQQQQRTQQRQHYSSQPNLNQPAPVNQFIHAPQSVFKPIENESQPQHNIYKPIPQMPAAKPTPPNTWQPPSGSVSANSTKPNSKSSSTASPQFLTQKNSPYSASPTSNATSPIGLPWLAKASVNNEDFKAKAYRFEEASLRDQAAEMASNSRSPQGIQRHNSLRTPRISNQQQFEDLRKRPSLPNAADPFQDLRGQYLNSNQELPPPVNISIKYNDYGATPTQRMSNFKSVPCLPTAVDNTYDGYTRQQQDSLTNPNAMPLILTNSNPVYNSNSENFYNSYAPMPPTRQFEYAPPRVDSTATSPSITTMAQTDYTDDDLDLDSDTNLLEYRAESKVMRKPESQRAVIAGRRTAHYSDDELYGKNSSAAKSLLSTMRTFGNGYKQKQPEKPQKKPTTPVTSPICLSPDGRTYQAPIVEPLFPEITNFTPNRDPLYIKSTESGKFNARQETNYRAPQTKSRRAPMQQSVSYDQAYLDQRPQPYQPQTKLSANLNQQSLPRYEPPYIEPMRGYQPYVQPKLPIAPAPYTSETQTSYVVTYPIDDHSDIEDQYSQSSQLLKRQRNFSENSTSSNSISYSYGNNLPSTTSNSYTGNTINTNAPSPNTSWTANPAHSVNEPVQIKSNQSSSQTVVEQVYSNQTHEQSKSEQHLKKQKQSQQQQLQKSTQHQSEPIKALTPKKAQKPEIAPKPQTTSAPNAYQELTHEHYQLPLRAPKLSTRSQTISTPGEETYTKSQLQQTTMTRQRTIETTTNNSNTIITPSKASKKFEQKQQRNQQPTTEVRRKSLGQIFDEQEKQRKAAHHEAQQSEENKTEVYKSSAPSDTPDIVKSSLPKDENQPILKKFGPPQRHHYMPNSYKSPLVSTQSSSHTETKKFNSTTQIVKHQEVVQHTSITNKPSIVEIPATPQPQDASTEDQIPRNIVFNNINAFTSMTRRYQDQERTTEHTQVNRLSKSDSWNQICQAQQAMAPSIVSPKFNTSGSELRRSKSGHSLAVPKMYEAGMNKEEISEKQRTVAAYFSGKKSPNATTETTEVITSKKSSINRIKTSEKVSAKRKSLSNNANNGNGGSGHSANGGGGLVRSATMPHIGNLNLLDESNVEDAFEQLMLAQQSPPQVAATTTEKTETKEKDGAVVTTTTKVTTRTVSGGTAPKPVSAFAKFKQLDRQSSLQSQKSPSTPTTPGCSASTPTTPGSAPIFKFTDPSLNARAATAKDQLLQWCQSKTAEYENVQITNFSSSWSDGLAFCALIHHFLPDAFDYSKLTPKSRRHNFELAFTVADEKAGIAPLLDVEDMVVMKRPDWKCVFVYVQSIFLRFRNCQ